MNRRARQGNQEVAAALKKHRLIRALSQEAIAQVADVAQPSVSNYESGRRDPPLSFTMRVAAHYGITVDQLLRLPADVTP